MHDYLPLLMIGAVVGVFSIVFLVIYLGIQDKKEAMGFDRNMPDGEIFRRLMVYAKPYWKNFLLVLVIMIFSIAYDLISPRMLGYVTNLVQEEFELSQLYTMVAAYAMLLAVSMVCIYFQSIILQRTGQKILSKIREDLFIHIESLSH